MQVIVRDNNIDAAIFQFKKLVARDGIFRTLKDREAKASVRRRNKRRKALRRRKKIEGGRDGWVSINEQSPSFKFIYRDGEYEKVLVLHKDMRQS